MTKVRVRKGMPSVQLTREEFRQRYMDRFFDPLFEANRTELDAIIGSAWKAYDEYHKNPRKRRAGRGFSKPDQQLPLCHWPCSCYPNYAMGQVNDWMSSIYPMWVRAHGVMIVTPVNWYQAPSSLKLMIDRLVCADGGNPDPTTTDGKDPRKAKELELKGWGYPRHLGGRLFSVVVHGDASGWRTCAGSCPTGSLIWDSFRRVERRRSAAMSGTTSLMRRATMISTKTGTSRAK